MIQIHLMGMFNLYKSFSAFRFKSSAFVIQKYIEKPLLINKRKFDIRVWSLITNQKVNNVPRSLAQMKGQSIMTSQYVSQIGYIRTACEEYSLEASDINKQYIHLTNNAIQKFADNYGKFEDGNQMSYAQFEQYVK